MLPMPLKIGYSYDTGLNPCSIKHASNKHSLTSYHKTGRYVQVIKYGKSLKLVCRGIFNHLKST